MLYDFDAVKQFEKIKSQAKCDDIVAAMLVLAESIHRGLDDLPRGLEYMLDRTTVNVSAGVDATVREPIVEGAEA